MGNLAVVSLIGLLVAIVLGFVRNANVGIIAIAVAFIIAMAFDLGAKAIIAGFNTSLFITMLGVTYLFSIVNSNDTLSLAAKKTVRLVGKRSYLLPIVLFLLGFVMSFIGPGAIPCLAILPIIAVPIALESGFNPMMLSIIAIKGAQAARMSPITPEAILVADLLADQGIVGATAPVFWSMFVQALVNAILAFLIFRGWKKKKKIEVEKEDIPKFNMGQWVSLAGLFIMMTSAIFFKLNVGLVSFTIGSILIIFGIAKESDAIKGVPWSVLLLVTGVGMLMEIVLTSGGIDILVSLLSSMMGPRTASAVMVATAGIMSFFSSGLGVVFPTLIPTVTGIAAKVGGMANPVELASMVVIGGTVTGLSPISVAGALIMAAVSANDEASKLYPNNVMFTELFGWAFIYMIASSILAYLGVFNLISTSLY